MIWKRFTASRMKPAIYDTISVKIKAGEYEFSLSTSKLAFDGFMSVYVPEEEKEESNGVLERLESGMELSLVTLNSSQHFTQPPAHYTEASLVKALEEQGLGGQVRMRLQLPRSLPEDMWQKRTKIYMLQSWEKWSTI